MEPNLNANASGEPLSPVAVITGLVSAGVTLLVSFGLDLTTEQIGAITAFVALAAPVVVWLVGRRNTTPTAAVAAVKNTDGVIVAGAAASSVDGTPVNISAL